MTVPRFLALLASVTALVLAGGATAQTPAPAPTSTPIVPPIIFSLPTPAATASEPAPAGPPAPTPTATATPAARRTPTPRPSATPTARATPRAAPSATPTPRATETPAAVVAPAPVPSDTATPAPVATTTPTPAPLSTARPTVVPAAPASGTPWWPFALGALVVAGLAAVFLLRRRGSDVVYDEPETITPVAEPMPEPAPLAEPTPAPAPQPSFLRRPAPAAPAPVPDPAPSGERAWIEVAIEPRRAGVNLLTATADLDVTVRNAGTAPADRIALDVRLTSAGTNQDAALADIFASPAEKLATLPFALEPGTERIVRVLVTLPRSSINVLTAGDRPMFVPLVTVSARYVTAGGEGQSTAAYAIGVERPGAAKLAPIWLDAPARMFDTVSARPHGTHVQR